MDMGKNVKHRERWLKGVKKQFLHSFTEDTAIILPAILPVARMSCGLTPQELV